jgi:hypothetical protein
MTANEARALRNMPAMPDGDGLVTPLNVLVGGQQAPNAPQPSGMAALPPGKAANVYTFKARVTQRQVDKLAQVLGDFFAHQGKAVLSAIGAGGQWWDHDRWNKELAADLHAASYEVTQVLGKSQAMALGYSADDYSPEQTVAYLQAVAARYADNINTTTKGQLDAAMADPDLEPAGVFTNATTTRAPGVAIGMGTFLAGFATNEAAAQIGQTHNVEPTKTWVTGANPRESHAAMDGETVGIDDTFSNGLAWPGAAGSDAAESAGCNCSVVINL